MTSLLVVMITFGTQATGKLGKRPSGWQPLSVSCCHRERANARTSDASLHATLGLTAASAAQEPGRSHEGKVMGNVIFEVSCHVKARDWDEVGDGVRTHACQHNIYWKRMHVGTNSRWKRLSLNVIPYLCFDNANTHVHHQKHTSKVSSLICHKTAQHAWLQSKALSFNLLQLPG